MSLIHSCMDHAPRSGRYIHNMSLGLEAYRPELGTEDLSQGGQRAMEIQARCWREELLVQLSELMTVPAFLSHAGHRADE